jgi:GDPmannose 4,6-dehydratase
MATRRALITGITGQDGSYLAELLLDQGYEVHGMVRRASTEKFDRIEHIRERVTLHQGDLLDHRSLVDTLRASQPEEIYNLAAMSFVGVSWVQPTLTAEFTGVSVTRLLEAMREVCPEARFYQASSSEMFGKVRETPQNELTPFYPRSPYGVAKVYGHHITVNYRESYDMSLCSGILFNHECVAELTPLLIRRNGLVEVVTPPDLMPLLRKGRSVQTHTPTPGELLEIWDGANWTELRAITATRRRRTDPDHRLLSIEARGGIVQATAHHTMVDEDLDPVRADEVEPGDKLGMALDWPETGQWTVLTVEFAELLGLLAADGYIGDRSMQFTNNSPTLQQHVTTLWSKCFLGTSRAWLGASGFTGNKSVGQLSLHGAGPLHEWLRQQLYTRTGLKQVPPLVLNGTLEVQDAFLKGYYAGDGLKKGNGDAIKTNSPVLAQGLAWLYGLRDRSPSVYAEHRAGRCYYLLNLPSAVRVGVKGQHLRRDPAEVRRVVEVEPERSEWVFDIETESELFCAGIGRLVVHNSPRRGLEFVTRKITWHAAAIRLGLRDHVALGNLEAKRDWGYAKDYVEAMWLMLQQDTPEDFVIATGETNTVQRCAEIAFDHVGLEWEPHVRIDDAFKRPAEVDLLVGNPEKAKRQLGWEPKTSFEQLIRLMVDADLELLKR